MERVNLQQEPMLATTSMVLVASSHLTRPLTADLTRVSRDQEVAQTQPSSEGSKKKPLPQSAKGLRPKIKGEGKKKSTIGR